MQAPASPAVVAPGWYADPAGRHEYRYWDGTWTANVADGGHPGLDPLAAKRPKRRGTVLLVLGALLALAGLVGAISMATMREPVIPSGTPRAVLSNTALDDPGGLTSDGLIAYRKDPYDFDVSFVEKDVADEETGTPFLKSIDGDWYGTQAYVSIDGDETGTAVPAITDKGWGTSMPDHAETVFSPSLHATLPISAENAGTSITVAAGMKVIVPYHSGGGFANAGSVVEKRATFFVVSPAQLQLRKDLDTWKTRDSIFEGGMIYLAFGVALLVWGLVRRRKGLRARTPGVTPQVPSP